MSEKSETETPETEGLDHPPLVRVCRIPGCEKPVFDLFPGKTSAGLCAGHGCEALAQFCESEWEGDSIQEISEGEQVGALIRDASGIGTKYQANANVIPPNEKP